MAATYDNSVTVDTFGDTTLTTGSFTVSSSADRAVVGGLSAFDTITGVTMTLAGQSAPAISGATLLWNGASSRMLLHGVAAPSSGSQTGTASWTTSTAASLGVVTAIGVNQSTPITNGTSIEEASPADLPITSAAGDLTVSLASNTNVVTTHTTNQTQRTTDFGSMDTGPGTANPTHTWTQAASELGVVGANFLAAGAGGRTTKNTRGFPLGIETGMGWRMTT